ncbi:hypothetical protein PT974_10277 [Cladobotryum mycophilum]|uniref:Uncharacterized protein n=1 Tax=Cladobotryum mycophilum TaxID=491253 RepID=A0ABR0SAB6_9HYPO
MTEIQSPPDLGPVPDGVGRFTYPGYPNQISPAQRQWIENNHLANDRLTYLRQCSDKTHAPSTWGYTIYSACSGTTSNDRFADGLRRLEDWIRWRMQATRFVAGPESMIQRETDYGPLDGYPQPADELAKRFWLEVIHDYPDKATVRAGLDAEEGEEDFTAVGEAFLDWVGKNGKETENLYVRNDHCLIVDEKSLQTLENLPASIPALAFDELQTTSKVLRDAWVWLLDREYFTNFLEHGPEIPHGFPNERPWSPWIRLRLVSLGSLWFDRPEQRLGKWQNVIQRDKQKFDRVSWWNSYPYTMNDSLRRRREAEKKTIQEAQ